MTYRLIRTATALVATGLLAGCSIYHSITGYMSSDKAALCPDAVILATGGYTNDPNG